MKKLLFLTSLFGVVLLAGCGSKTPTGMADTRNAVSAFTTTGFSLEYPATWTAQENIYGAQAMFFSPQLSGDKFRENVGIVRETLPSDMAVSDYYTSIKNQLTSIVQGYQELSNEDITVAGVAAKKIIYVGTQSTYELKWMQTMLIKNKTAYIISYTASAGTFDEFKKEADAIVKSFVLK